MKRVRHQLVCDECGRESGPPAELRDLVDQTQDWGLLPGHALAARSFHLCPSCVSCTAIVVVPWMERGPL